VSEEPRDPGFDEPTRNPRPAPTPVKSFSWFIIGLIGAAVVLLLIGMAGNVVGFFG